MRDVFAYVVLLAAGCDGVFGLDKVTLVDSTTPVDAAPIVCTPGTPWGARSPVPIDGIYSVEAARFNRERTTAYLSLCPASGDKTGCDLYSSQYSTQTGMFTAFNKYFAVSAAGVYDSYPTVTPDGGHLVFASSRNGQLRIWVAAAVNGSYDAPVLTKFDPFAAASNEPYILGDGRTMYFQADMGGNPDLYRTSGPPPAFGAVTPVPGANGTGQELAPVVSDDERELFFASNRATGVSLELDIYTATRSDPSSPFSTPTKLDAISTAGIDWPVWISPDLCELYYINKISGVATLYVTRR